MDTRTFDCVPVGTGTAGHLFDAPVFAVVRGRAVHDRPAPAMPRLGGGNTNAPISMIAEKAADRLRGRPAPIPV